MLKHYLMLLAIFALILWANYAYGQVMPTGSPANSSIVMFNGSGAIEDGGNSTMGLTGVPEAVDDGLAQSNGILNEGNDADGTPMMDNKIVLGSTGVPEAMDDGLELLLNDTLNGNDTNGTSMPDTTSKDGMLLPNSTEAMDGNESEDGIAPVGGDEDQLREMMAKQKEADDSVKAAETESQEQLPPPSENEPEQEVPAEGNIQLRSMFDADAVEEPANKVIFAYDYYTGQPLNEEEAKKASLITIPHEGYPKFQAMATAGAIVPVIIHFKQLSSNCSHEEDDGLSKPIFTINVCLKPKDTKCNGERILICFVGKLDPANNEVIELFQVANIPDNEVAKQCNSTEVLDKWVEMGGKKGQIMHGLELSTSENKIQLANSFHPEKSDLEPYSDDNCVEIDIGTKDTLLTAQFRHAGGVSQPNEIELMVKLANGEPLRKQLNIESILTMDIMVNFNMSKPMLAFVGPRNADKCGMEITISGDSVKRCADKECSRVENPSLSPIEEKKTLYKKTFDNMIPVLAPDQLPKEYSKIIYLELDPKNERPRAVLTTQGWELPFAVVTKDWEPPTLQIIHPPNAAFCTERNNFEANEFVFSYNGRPDCYGRLAWGERKIRFMDNMGGQSKVLIVDDAKLKIHGPNGDEFWSADQFNEDKMLGRGTCSIEAHQMPIPVNNETIMWQMILSPLKGANTLRLPRPRCTLGIGVYLDEYHLMVPKLSNSEK